MKSKSLTLKILFAAAFLLILTVSIAFIASTKDGEAIVKEMHSKWKGKWYPHISFEQEAIFYKDKKVTKTEIWQEILSSPGKLHIRFNGFNTLNGAIYNNDSVYHYQSGVLKSKKRETNYLELLGFDIYLYEPEVSISKLKELGFNLNKSYVSTYRNQKILIVGSDDPADMTSSQFWVDSRRYLVRRVIKNTSGSVRDVHFNSYKKIDKNWVATEMVFKNEKDTIFVERYFNITFPEKVSYRIYDPVNFSLTAW